MPTRLVGLPGLPDIVREFRADYGEIVLPAVLLGFLFFGLLAVHKQGRYGQGFIAFTFCFIIISSQLGVTFAPFVHAHRYSDAGAEISSNDYIWMVDAEGNELLADDRMTGPVRLHNLATKLGYEWDDEKRVEVSKLLLKDAEAHRSEVNLLQNRASHPPPSVPYRWDRIPLRNDWGFETSHSTLDEYDDFVSIRIYAVETKYESHGYEVIDRQQECLVEIKPESGTVIEGCNV